MQSHVNFSTVANRKPRITETIAVAGLVDRYAAEPVIPIYQNDLPCQSCGKTSRRLFMGVCHRCDGKTFYTPAGPYTYLCWMPFERDTNALNTKYSEACGMFPDNPAFAAKKWWVKL